MTLRSAISARLASPGALTATARAIAPAWGVSPESAQSTLCAWLRGRRKGIPLHAVEAILAHLDLVIVPAPASGPKHGPMTPTEAKRRAKDELVG